MARFILETFVAVVLAVVLATPASAHDGIIVTSRRAGPFGGVRTSGNVVGLNAVGLNAVGLTYAPSLSYVPAQPAALSILGVDAFGNPVLGQAVQAGYGISSYGVSGYSRVTGLGVRGLGVRGLGVSSYGYRVPRASARVLVLP
jgi:hypothetical protein